MSFTGGPAPQISPEVLTQQQKDIREGGDGDLQEAAEMVGSREQDLNDKRMRDMTMTALTQQSQANGAAGNGMGMQFMRHQQTGYGGLLQPAMMQKQTIVPFDRKTDSTRNYQGIVQSFDPRLFSASAQIKQQVQQMEPFARRVLADKRSLYAPMGDFPVNALNLANQRIRENDIYAFI